MARLECLTLAGALVLASACTSDVAPTPVPAGGDVVIVSSARTATQAPRAAPSAPSSPSPGLDVMAALATGQAAAAATQTAFALAVQLNVASLQTAGAIATETARAR